MNREEAQYELKDPRYFDSYLSRNYPVLHEHGEMCCFIHEEKTPSMKYAADNKRKGYIHCFGCDVSFDIFSLYAHDHNLDCKKDFPKIIDELCDMFDIDINQDNRENHIDNTNKKALKETNFSFTADDINDEKLVKDFSQIIEACREEIENERAQKYLCDVRRKSKAVIAKFKLGYNRQHDSIIIPTGDGKHTYKECPIDRSKGSSGKYFAIGGQALFNSQALYDSEEPVFIVEGEFDAMSIIEAGGRAVALGSTSNYKLLVDTLASNPPTARKLILALDNDVDGQKKSAELQAALKDNPNVHVSSVNASFFYGGMKDANEAQIADEDTFKIRVTSRMAKERSNSDGSVRLINALDHRDDFEQAVRDRALRKAIKTFDYALDVVLDGGLSDGLYIIGAMPGAGKTTFVLQLADAIALGGHDVLFFSLEMSTDELIARSLSRMTYTLMRDTRGRLDALHYACTALQVLNSNRDGRCSNAQHELIADAQDAYHAYSKHITFAEGDFGVGVDFIAETVFKYIEEHGTLPVVFVDYLQILAADDPRDTEKRNTDRAVVELKRLSRRYKIPVIAVSSFNRDAYGQPASLKSFKESGGIEYGCDVLLSLNRVNTDTSDSDDDGKFRDIELDILKHRNGVCGYSILYRYAALFNCFEPRVEHGNGKRNNDELELARQASSLIGLKEHGRIKRSSDGKRQSFK